MGHEFEITVYFHELPEGPADVTMWEGDDYADALEKLAELKAGHKGRLVSLLWR